MSTLKSQFDYGLNQNSPVVDEFSRTVHYDEDGKEVVSYEKTDLPAITKSHGVASDWSLNKLLKAGVNPNFGIHTSSPTRLENASEVEQASSEFMKFLDNVLNTD